MSTKALNGKNDLQRTKRLPSIIKFISDYWYILIAALIPFVLTFLMYLARGHYPFGDGSVLVIDLNGQYAAFFEALRNFVVKGDSSLLYSFSRSLGGEFMGIYNYYIASPFSYLVCLFPEDRMLEALLFMFMAKAGTCGATMAFYLHKSDVRVNRIAIIGFSTMYALAAYAVVYQHNTMWIDAMIWLPLLMYGVEQLIKYGKYKVYVIFLALTLISQYYIGYMVCLSVLVYFFVYLWGFKDTNNPLNERYHKIRSFLRIAFYTVIAIGIAAFTVISAYYSLTFGKNEFSDPDWSFQSRFTLLELFYKFLPASYDTAHRGGNPWLYCGLLAILLIPMYFFNKKFKTAEKVGYAALFGIFFFSMVASPLDIIWHGFQKPNELEYRYSFIICFFMIALAYRAFTNMRFSSRKPVAVSAAFILFGLMILESFSDQVFADIIDINGDFEFYTFQTVWLTIALLIIYTILICLIPRVKNKELVSCVLVFFVCVEIFVNGLCCLNDVDQDWNFGEYSPYNDYFHKVRPIINTVQENDPTFYRMEKTYHRKTNDNMVLGIRGLSNSTSTLNADTIYFLRCMGYASRSHLSQYHGGTPVNDSIFGIKYIMTDKDLSKYYGDPAYDKEDWEQVLDNDKYAVYQNPYYLSIAFLADNAMADYKLADFENPFERLNAMITMLLGEEETIEVFVPATQISMTTKDLSKSTTKASGNTPSHTLYKGDGGKLIFEYDIPRNTELFVYFPTNYNRSVNMNANGQSVGTWGNTGKDTWCIVSIGDYATNKLDLTLTVDNSYDNFYIVKDLEKPFVYSLDMEALADAMTRLQQGNVQIDPENYREDYLPGTVTTTKDNQLVMTTIPFDDGWRIFVDGKAVEPVELADALLGYYIPTTGEHEIEMRYMPKEYVLGISISVVFTIVFVLLIIFEKKLRRIPGYGDFFGIPEPVKVDAQDTALSEPSVPDSEPSQDPPQE